jgi:hypothetical protein
MCLTYVWSVRAFVRKIIFERTSVSVHAMHICMHICFIFVESNIFQNTWGSKKIPPLSSDTLRNLQLLFGEAEAR